MQLLSPLPALRRIRLAAWTAVGVLAVGSALSCTPQTSSAPTRALDRPSDLALYCVDYEVDGCLPQGVDADRDPEGYLAAYCGQVEFAAYTTPRATVLPLSSCEDEPSRVRVEKYLAPVRRAAYATGRDVNYPCCAPGTAPCETKHPACSRRLLTALIANTARGELAVAEVQQRSPGTVKNAVLRSLHGGKPGFGFLPVGRLPAHVRTFAPAEGSLKGDSTAPNAWGVTANAGSCDLSVVSLQRIAELSARADICYDPGQTCPGRDCTAESCPQTVQPYLPGASGSRRTLRARPSWVEIAPWATGTQRAALVAYPSCGIVASVALSDAGGGCRAEAGCGQVLDALGFDKQGKPYILSAADLAKLDCAADCGEDGAASLMPDPATIPVGGSSRPLAYPTHLAIEPQTSRVLVGDAYGDALTIVDFDPAAPSGARFRGTPRRVALDFAVLPESLRGGQRGTTSIRIAPRNVAGQFAYVVALDGSVRVVDLDREVECETNPDPRFLQQHAGDSARVLPDELNQSNLRRLSCFPNGTTPRSPLAVGPGILPPGVGLAKDVGFLHMDLPSCDVRDAASCPYVPDADSGIWQPTAAARWVGDYAWILGGGGVLTAVQLADACPQPSFRACFPEYGALHRLALLSTRTQYQPNPELDNLPAYTQAVLVKPADRLMNVRRLAFGRSQTDSTRRTADISVPLMDSDGVGLPVFTTRVDSTAVSYFGTVSDEQGKERRRLQLPAPASYYYLPVDPVCDVALASQADSGNLASPGDGLPPEPLRRPVSMLHFTDPANVSTETWSLEWEGTLPNLSRYSGRLLGNGTMTDLSGLYCSYGVEDGDMLRLRGCLSDADCTYLGSTTRCQREPGQASTTPGLCLTNDQADECRRVSQTLLATGAGGTSWPATWERRYRITKAEQQVGLGNDDIGDRLTLDEIAEPEFEIERESCTDLGQACKSPVYRPGRGNDGSLTNSDGSLKNKARGTQATCRITSQSAVPGQDRSCIVSCQTHADCGVGYVCGHSPYEAVEKAAGKTLGPRCVRAPLIHPNTGPAGQPIGQGGADSIIKACFPDLAPYEVRAGGAFLVARTNSNGSREASTLVQRAPDGRCRRPSAADPSAKVARLFEPRLRLGPAQSVPDGDPRRCAADPKAWISHRVGASPEAEAQPSCQALYQGSVSLPFFGSVQTVRGKQYDPQTTADAWIKKEYELLSSLSLDSTGNQCILTDAAQESFVGSAVCSSGFCRFPTDHTETVGVRRIHFENALGNLVMRVPRVLFDPANKPAACDEMKPTQACNPERWAVPPDGYVVSFGVRSGQLAYQQQARPQTPDAQQQVDSLAHSLRSAVSAPGGVVYMVDEGRSGDPSGLRGRIMRAIGAFFDSGFLVR